MAIAKSVQKKQCHDCKKEIKIDKGKILEGVRAVYNIMGDKIEVFKCRECFEKDKSLKNYQTCEVYSRVVGYLRPVQQWNTGKQKEFKERREYKIKRSAKNLKVT